MFGRKKITQLRKDLEFVNNELFFVKDELEGLKRKNSFSIKALKCKLLGAEFFGDCNLVSNKQVIDIFEELK